MRKTPSSLTLVLVALAASLPALADDAPVSGEYAQGYALVHWQADKLKNVDKLLIVKGESDAVEEITEQVAELSGAVAAELESYASSREWIELEREHLPPIEAGARDRMGLDIAGELLFSFGCGFEQKLMFTETVAVLRMLALAQEMEAQAPDEEQEELWAGIVADVEPVFERLRGMLDPCGEER